MSENMQKANEVYRSLIRTLDDMGWKYEKDEENLLIKSGVNSDDLPVEFIVRIMAQNEVIQFLSSLPFRMPEEKRVDGALAVSVANYGLVDGSFDYDIRDGEIRYRLTTSYRDASPAREAFEYIIMVAASTVDNYNDRFFMLAKDMITLEQFIEKDGSNG